MENETNQHISQDIVLLIKDKLGSNFLSLVMFGSGNNEDFVEGVSDLDYFMVLENLSLNVLKDIELIRRNLMKKFSIKIDIKLLTRSEVEGALNGFSSSEFFNGWGLWAISKGKQKIFYGKAFWEERLTDSIDTKNYSIDRAIYYLHKLRKVLQGEEHLFHNEIKELSPTEKNKIIISCLKNVLVFHLAVKGIGVYTNAELIDNVDDKFKSLLVKLFRNKSENIYDMEQIEEFYNLIEKEHTKIIEYGLDK